MSWIRRTVSATFLVGALLVAGAASALTADIGSVVDEVSETGFYLDSGVSISESEATEIVSAARNNGSRFYLIVLAATPPGGNTVFAEAVYDELGISAGTVLVLSPEDVGYLTENEGFTETDMVRNDFRIFVRQLFENTQRLVIPTRAQVGGCPAIALDI